MTMPRETLGLYEELLQYVGDKLGRRVELVQRRTYRETNDLIEARLVDVAFVCSGPYVLGHEKFGMELLVAPEVEGRPIYYSYIIARTDSGIDSFEGFRGKTFAFMDPESSTGFLYPNYRLAQMGESPSSFFHSYFYTYGHDNSVKAVLDKTVVGAAVENLIFDYMAARDPAVASQIKVIEKSPPLGIPPVVVHPALDPGVKEELRNIFLNMDKDDRGKDILGKMNIDRFVLLSDKAYDSIREMYYQVQRITAGK
jgi:phosphonate transport system substrate-binding protein